MTTTVTPQTNSNSTAPKATAPHTLTLSWVAGATRTFVFAQAMREAVSLALAGGMNYLFSGPGGHAKSEFIAAVYRAIREIDPFTKSLGQGTTTEELFGGIDMDALNRAQGASIQYNTDNSFLAHTLAVLEELFDAPSRVLMYLKDTLTARELRNGAQRVPMLTSVIAAATNHSPAEIAEAGPAVAALVERFPIQLEVKWSRYNGDDFFAMFKSVEGSENDTASVSWDDVMELQMLASSVNVSDGIMSMLAEILAELRADGITISPRTAMIALKMVRAAAAINSRDTAIADDIIAIKYLPGAFNYAQRILELIEENRAEIEAEEHLAKIKAELDSLRCRFDAAQKVDELTGIKTDMIHVRASYVDNLRVGSSQGARMRALNNAFDNLSGDINTRIAELAKVEESKLLDKIEAQISDLEAMENSAQNLDDFTELLELIRDFQDEINKLRFNQSTRRFYDARSRLEDTESNVQEVVDRMRAVEVENRAMTRLREIENSVRHYRGQLKKHSANDLRVMRTEIEALVTELDGMRGEGQSLRRNIQIHRDALAQLVSDYSAKIRAHSANGWNHR